MMGPAESAPAPAPSVVVANPVLTALVLAKLAALKGYIYTNILNNGEVKQAKRHWGAGQQLKHIVKFLSK